MGMRFRDRVPTYANRYRVVPTGDSSPFYAVLERADEPTVAGTPLNAETLNGMLDEIYGKMPTESAEYPGCYYRTVDGETEWINPPMMVNTEYRTSERDDGDPVYVKRIGFYITVAVGQALESLVHETSSTADAIISIQFKCKSDGSGESMPSLYPVYTQPVNKAGEPVISVTGFKLKLSGTDGEYYRHYVRVVPLGKEVLSQECIVTVKYTKP